MLTHSTWINVPTALVRCSVIEDARFDEADGLADDLGMFLRLMRRVDAVAYIAEPLVALRMHAGAVSSGHAFHELQGRAFSPAFVAMGNIRDATARAHERGYGKHRIHEYGDVVERMLRRPPPECRRYPCVTPSWDNTPRRKRHGLILRNSTPELNEPWLRETIETSMSGPAGETLVFINAWYEWGEGAHLEPSRRWGRDYLEATRNALHAAGSGDPRMPDAPAVENTVAGGALRG